MAPFGSSTGAFVVGSLFSPPDPRVNWLVEQLYTAAMAIPAGVILWVSGLSAGPHFFFLWHFLAHHLCGGVTDGVWPIASSPHCHWQSPPLVLCALFDVIDPTTPLSSAFLKAADGLERHCTTPPLLTAAHPLTPIPLPSIYLKHALVSRSLTP